MKLNRKSMALALYFIVYLFFSKQILANPITCGALFSEGLQNFKFLRISGGLDENSLSLSHYNPFDIALKDWKLYYTRKEDPSFQELLTSINNFTFSQYSRTDIPSELTSLLKNENDSIPFDRAKLFITTFSDKIVGALRIFDGTFEGDSAFKKGEPFPRHFLPFVRTLIDLGVPYEKILKAAPELNTGSKVYEYYRYAKILKNQTEASPEILDLLTVFSLLENFLDHRIPAIPHRLTPNEVDVLNYAKQIKIYAIALPAQTQLFIRKMGFKPVEIDNPIPYGIQLLEIDGSTLLTKLEWKKKLAQYFSLQLGKTLEEDEIFDYFESLSQEIQNQIRSQFSP